MYDRAEIDAAILALNKMCDGHAITHVIEVGFGLRLPVPIGLDTRATRALAKAFTEALGRHIPFAFGAILTLATDGRTDEARQHFVDLISAIDTATTALGKSADMI